MLQHAKLKLTAQPAECHATRSSRKSLLSISIWLHRLFFDSRVQNHNMALLRLKRERNSNNCTTLPQLQVQPQPMKRAVQTTLQLMARLFWVLLIWSSLIGSWWCERTKRCLMAPCTMVNSKAQPTMAMASNFGRTGNMRVSGRMIKRTGKGGSSTGREILTSVNGWTICYMARVSSPKRMGPNTRECGQQLEEWP